MLLTCNTRAAIVGASGGIGAAFCERLHARGVTVHPFSRAGDVPVDLLDEDSIAAAADSIDAPLDLVIVATGVLHGDSFQPEKTMRQLDGRAMLDVLAVNTVGPALVAKHFLPKLTRREPSVFAALSARVGSIGDNRLGGWLSYRSSKAALNMALKTLAIEHRRTHKHGAVIGLHPGTVDTGLSKPFQRGVPEGKLFSPAFAAERLLTVIEDISAADSGGVFAWDGQRIEP